MISKLGGDVNPPSSDETVDPAAFTPLSLLMENSILIPLRAQLGVVNSAAVNYLLVDAKLNDHFKVRHWKWIEWVLYL